MKKTDAKFIWKKLEEWTRCDIMARFGRFDNLEYAQYAVKKLEIEDEIRKFLFGSSELVELGYKWGLVKRKEEPRRKKVAKKNKKLKRKGQKTDNIYRRSKLN